MTLALPNFMVIGAPRCASTALCRALARHPQIFITDPKETFFFSHDRKYRSEEGWDWYRGLFSGVSPHHLAIGEGTTDYSDPTLLALILPRLERHVPNCRFIYIVRHPLRRIESAWRRGEVGQAEDGDFCRSVREKAALLQFSSYWKVLDAYSRVFGRDRVLVLFTEDWKSKPEGELRRCFEFLGTDSSVRIEASEIVNPSATLRRQNRVAARLRRSWGAQVARRVLPREVRHWLHLVSTRQANPKTEWDDETREFVMSELEAGLRRFLVECGKPEGFWELGPASVEDDLRRSDLAIEGEGHERPSPFGSL